MLQLHTYYRSVSAHRVRIALNFKGVPYEAIYTDLDGNMGDRLAYFHTNPQGLIPALVVRDDLVITQSSAILEYLEERYPERAILPDDLERRARVRSVAQIAIADTHPLNNLRVLRYLRDRVGMELQARRDWFDYWMHKAFTPMESILEQQPEKQRYCFGETVSLADICLVPQVYLAEHTGLDMSEYPNLRRIYRTCMTLAAFQSAAPETQTDLLRKTR
jgi:maleylacetoacetate isomerase